MNNIVWSRKAQKQLLKLPKKPAVAIYAAVDELKEFPPGDHVKKLTGYYFDYCLRVGRYRMLFNYEETVRIISIEEVKKRDDRTYT